MGKSYNAELSRRIEPELQKFFERAEAIRWTPDDIPYDRIDRSKLTLSEVFAVFVTLHIENYSDVYTRLLLEHFDDTPRLAEFIRNWEREEENHARTLERYLVELGVPLEELKRNYALVDKADFPFPSHDQAGLNVFVFFQELLTREMYAKMLKTCREPVLAEILKRVVRDEERHYRFYKQTLELRKLLDPRDTFEQFRKIVRIFGMPETMYRQTGMTSQLVSYYRYDPSEILAIATPIMKFLEARPSRWLARFPRLQRAWVNRRALAYLAQSPYFWGHLMGSLKTILGIRTVTKADQKHVDSVVARLATLLDRPDCSPAVGALYPPNAAHIA